MKITNKISFVQTVSCGVLAVFTVALVVWVACNGYTVTPNFLSDNQTARPCVVKVKTAVWSFSPIINIWQEQHGENVLKQGPSIKNPVPGQPDGKRGRKHKLHPVRG